MEDTVHPDETKLYKEIDLIQACITRMADNSFRLKELYISLLAVMLTVLISQKCNLIIIGIFSLGITTIFWSLDAFFLEMETLYRWKYEWVIIQRPAGNTKHLSDLNPHNKETRPQGKKESFFPFFISKTLRVFYGIIWIASIGVIIYAMTNYAIAAL